MFKKIYPVRKKYKKFFIFLKKSGKNGNYDQKPKVYFSIFSIFKNYKTKNIPCKKKIKKFFLFLDIIFLKFQLWNFFLKNKMKVFRLKKEIKN